MAAPPFKVKAVYAYESPHDDDLSFPEGQIITVTEEEDADWYVGEYTDASGSGKSGLFPKNFVERFEPQAPPRPTRSRTKPTEATEPKGEPSKTQPQPTDPIATRDAEPVSPVAATAPVPASKAAPADLEPPPAPKPAPAAPVTKQPPPVSQKPSSFRDRIAAFNQPAAAPIAPFKPSGATSQSFIKKPFVAPPPSRNAYVPPVQSKHEPHKVYRREEDPEIAEQQAEAEQAAERAGFNISSTNAPQVEEGAEEGDEPKQMSLKDRIAALQKQQAEQAQRRADASQKEKPKRPPKKRVESNEAVEESLQQDQATGNEPVGRLSSDIPRDPPRVPSRAPEEPFSDGGNDADQSAAGETTEDAGGSSTSVEDEDDSKRRHSIPSGAHIGAQRVGNDAEGAQEGDDEEEEEEEVDEETRRQNALRERMAKLSGGMGMVGMIGPPGGMPQTGTSGGIRKKKAAQAPESSEQGGPQQGVRMVPIPGMGGSAPGSSVARVDAGDDDHTAMNARINGPADLEYDPKPPRRTSTGRSAPPVPAERPQPGSQSVERVAPPPVPSERPGRPSLDARPAPPPPPAVLSPTEGSESDDEMPEERTGAPLPPARPAEPVRPPQSPPRRSMPPPVPTSPRASFSERGPPPQPPLQGRGPPPPPPVGPPLRQPTSDLGVLRQADEEEGESEYEGDYDTDIASSAKHKDALKHTRTDSIDELTADEGSLQQSPQIPHAAVAVPGTSRAAPPPPPTQQEAAGKHSAQPFGSPRVAPPPVPAARQSMDMQDDEYDPYRYTGTPTTPGGTVRKAPTAPSGAPQLPPIGAMSERDDDEELYAAPKRSSTDRVPPSMGGSSAHYDRAAPPPPPHGQAGSSSLTPMMAGALPPRRSLDREHSMTIRRSSDVPRASHDGGFIAHDVDLGHSSRWWAQPNTPPPSLQNRRDVLFEMEENASNKSGSIGKTVYVIYQDYSQSVISARFDGQSPDIASLEQRHEPPPGKLRQDQLEDAHARFGARLSGLVAKTEGSVVGDGNPQVLVLELLSQLPGALFPIGSRSYGALVYQNIGNATVQQFDEIRPGDVVSFRNAKFSGKHGAMHTKYSQEVGKPDHVAIVAEWDGTKKKVRGWEQGRDNEGGPDDDGVKGKSKSKGGKIKVKAQSFRLDDLRSGEVRVWRVMPRSWVGWEDAGT